MNGIDNINLIVLSAKTGNEEDFKKLWNCHLFLIENIFNSFLKEYKFLSRKKHEVYHFMYFWFWEVLNEHNFKNNYYFSYNLKEKIINKMKIYLNTNCQISNDQIESSLKSILEIEKVKHKKNKKLYYALKSLTVKQLQAIQLHFFEKNKLQVCASKINISERSLRDRLNTSYKKMSNIVFGIKSKRKNKFKEKAYALPR